MDDSGFERLLKNLVSGQVRTLAQLATELDVDGELLEQMLQDLERAEYVRRVQVCCDTKCAGCSLKEMCRLIQGGRIWAVTDRGLRAAGGSPSDPRTRP